MASAHIRDILTAFNPSLDFFAITTGDGRIKIWDTLKAQLQTEFADFTSTRDTNLFDTKGHLSVDYTCIKWLSFEIKKKGKHSSSLLLLGTGSGEQSILNSSNVSGNWVEPKSGTMPKDAGRRRVQASGQSAGQSTSHWFTGSDGRKVYVSKKWTRDDWPKCLYTLSEGEWNRIQEIQKENKYQEGKCQEAKLNI